MSDSHVHHQLSPQSIRFCPLCGGGLERRAVPPEGKQEMVCGGCAFIFYLNHKVVAATIPEHEGRILLTRRTIQPARGKWTFPGGFVDWGEPVEAGAVRETWEETGLNVDLGGLLGVYSYAGTPIVIVVWSGWTRPGFRGASWPSRPRRRRCAISSGAAKPQRARGGRACRTDGARHVDSPE
jgi:NUDIX domain/Nudix N-terminal